MTIAERIQNLRKRKGISQEELASNIGVSRQSVSKWESEQSTPDLDKVIIMSDFFEVTTDYILKGIEMSDKTNKKKINLNAVFVLATAFNLIGIIIASFFWYEKMSSVAVVSGLVIMVLGCMIFGISLSYASNDPSIPKVKRNFLLSNIWIISFIPISFLYNMIVIKDAIPFPIAKYTLSMKVGFGFLYCLFCITVIALYLIKYNKSRS